MASRRPSLRRATFYRWWRRSVVASVNHGAVIERIIADSGWSGRYIFMTMMSGGIAVLGLLLSSPAVVIGAMLISPLMSPILGLGFSLAIFDFAEMRRSLDSTVIGTLVAVGFTALIVLVSPLKEATTEIISRTRPNLFDLLVALFAGLAGSYAIIRGRGETIVGVAIATALMPPLAVVGYGLATANLVVFGGSLALFFTNLLTIALAATIMARVYGFGHRLSDTQSWTQTSVLLIVFVAMSVPLALSLNRIAREAYTTTKIRSSLDAQFGGDARVTQLDIDFDSRPLEVQTVVIAPRREAHASRMVEMNLAKALGRPVRLHLDQVLLDPAAGTVDTQRAEIRQAKRAEAEESSGIARMIAAISGTTPEAVVLDRAQRQATVNAAALPGATPATYRLLEQRANAAADDWRITIIPPPAPLPQINFDSGDDSLDAAATDAVILAAWQAARANVRALSVPGLAAPTIQPSSLSLDQRRAKAVADLLAEHGIGAEPAAPEGQTMQLRVSLPAK